MIEVTVARNKIGRPRRIDGEAIRIPLDLSEEEDNALREAMEKTFPGASRAYVLRRLIAEFCKDAKIAWPKEKP